MVRQPIPNQTVTISRTKLSDLDLDVGSPEDRIVRFKVSSAILKQASTVFRQLLVSRHKSWLPNSTSRLSLEDDPEPMHFLLLALHHRSYDLPKVLTRTQAYLLALVCEKYECLEALQAHMGPQLSLTDERPGLLFLHGVSITANKGSRVDVGWLTACHYFGWKDEFLDTARQIIFHATSDSNAELCDDFGDPLVADIAPFMTAVFEKLEDIREKAQKRILDILKWMPTRICTRDPAFSAHEVQMCDAVARHNLKASMRNAFGFEWASVALWDRSAREEKMLELHGLSIVEMMRRIGNFEFKNLASCKEGLKDVASSTSELARRAGIRDSGNARGELKIFEAFICEHHAACGVDMGAVESALEDVDERLIVWKLREEFAYLLARPEPVM